MARERGYCLTMALLAIAPLHAQSDCAVAAGISEPDASFNQLFTQNGPGWTGGDSTYSVPLPDGRVVWMFSDSFFGTVDPVTRLRSNPIFNAHNSLVVQNADNSLQTIAGSGPLGPTSLFQPGGSTSDWFWVGDGIVEPVNGASKLRVLLLRERSAGSGAFSFAFVDTYLATLSLPSLTVDSIIDLNLGSTIAWTAALMRDGSYTYVYGQENHRAHVARVPIGSLDNTGAWTFWNGTDWVADAAASVSILDDSISDEFSVTRVNDSYVLITEDTSAFFSSQKNILLYSSCNPIGPFTSRTVIYSTPETGQNGIWSYNPHAHREWTRDGTLLVSYNINTMQNDGQLHADWYRPKFIRVPISSACLTTCVAAAKNAASGISGPVSPQEFISIYGNGIGPLNGVGSSTGVERGLNGVEVDIGGVEAFLSYVSANQINALVPSGLSGDVPLEVTYNGGTSAEYYMTVTGVTPGIFTAGGTGQAVVVNQDNTLNSMSNPATPGSYITFWATGQGLTAPSLTDGQEPVSPNFPPPAQPVAVSIGGIQTMPSFAGLTFAGVLQVNIQIPTAVAPSSAVPIALLVGNSVSQPGVTVAVDR